MADMTSFTFGCKLNSLNNAPNLGESSEVNHEFSDVHNNHFANLQTAVTAYICSLHTNVSGMNSVTALEESDGHHNASAVFVLVHGRKIPPLHLKTLRTLS